MTIENDRTCASTDGGESMTKNKRQLRAEAVERLNGIVLNTGSAIKKLAIALDVKWNPDNAPISMSKLQNRLRDLLTDDDANDDSAHENNVSADDVDANDANAMQDTREKMDDRWYAHGGVMQLTRENVEKLRGIVMPYHNGDDSREKLEDDIQSDLAALSEYGKLMLDWYVVMDWLDRQAAITKAEQREWWGGVVAELQAKVDELTAERDELTDKIGKITDEASELMKKQPYTFDVHDVPGSLQTVGRYIDELTAERDEWKAKAEAKSAKRAAAVERLKNSEYHTALDDVCAMLGWGHEPHFEGATDALIDLLTDDDANDDSAPEKGVTTVRVSSDNGRTWSAPCAMGCEPDSREKLEAAVHDLFWGDNLQRYARQKGYLDGSGIEVDESITTTNHEGHVTATTVMHLLDRQAAITEREFIHSHPVCGGSDTCHATNLLNSESVERETPQTAENVTSKDEIRDFDVWSVAYEIYCAGGWVDNGNEPNPPTDGIWKLLDRQAAITERELCKQQETLAQRMIIDGYEFELFEMRKQISELTAELGSGTCENASELNTDGLAGYYFTCSECGLSICASMGIGEIELSSPRSFCWKADGEYEFERCPRCGKRVSA